MFAEKHEPVTILDNNTDKIQPIEVSATSEPESSKAPKPISTIEEKILSVFNGKPLTAKEILLRLHIDLTTNKLTSILKKLNNIEVKKEKSVNHYYLKGSSNTHPSLSKPQSLAFY